MTNFTMLFRDRYTLTKQALDSLAQSQAEDMTVTVLDDRSHDLTRELVKDHEMVATYGRNEAPCGTGGLRNKVVSASATLYGRGDYLYLSDCDVFFQPHWLDILITCYEVAWHHGYRVLGAYNHPFHRPISVLPLGASAIHEVTALTSQSMLMRWEVWDKYGPFCDTPVDKVCQSEDVDFTNKIRADGFKIGVVSPALIVNTGITNSFGEHIPGWEMVRDEAPAGVIVE
jgi:GT2 family glycosyltransferase